MARMTSATLYTLLLTVVEAAASVAFALSGLLEAARKRLDRSSVRFVGTSGPQSRVFPRDSPLRADSLGQKRSH